MKTYLILNKHTHKYEIIHHCIEIMLQRIDYNIKKIPVMVQPFTDLMNYDIVVKCANGKTTTYPMDSFELYELIEPTEEVHPN